MAYNIRVWSRENLPEEENGTVDQGTGWLLDVTSRPCGPDDLRHAPNDMPFEPRFVIEISLEPVGAPPAAYAAFETRIKAIAKRVSGVIEDPQQAAGRANLTLSEKSQAKIKKLKADNLRREEEFRRLEAPLVRDLRAAGYAIETLEDMRRIAPCEAAITILVDHLGRPCSKHLRAGIALELRRPDAKVEANRIFAIFRSETDRLVKDLLANAIVAFADDSVLGEVISLVRDRASGSSRFILLQCLVRSKDPRARATLVELQDDSTFDKVLPPLLRRAKIPKRH
jgi:hypothetical protein